MKFVFIDKDEQEKDVILQILHSYNVKYTVKKDYRRIFCNYNIFYNIEIDVDYDFYNFLNSEIENKVELLHRELQCRQQLELNFHLPSYNKKSRKKIRSSHKIPEEYTITFETKEDPNNMMTIIQFIEKFSQGE